jgi:hypothetical protein
MMRDSIVPATDWKPSDGLDQMARWWPGEDWASLADSYLDTFATMHAGGIPGHCMRQAIGALVREGNQRVPSPARVAAGIMAQVAEYERERKAGLHVREAHHPQPSWWPAPAEPPCSCGGVMALNRHPAYLFCQRCCSVRPAETTDGRVRVHMTDHERLGVRTSTRDAWTCTRCGARPGAARNGASAWTGVTWLASAPASVRWASGWPGATRAPRFHPCCRHVWTTFTRTLHM